MSKDKLQLFLNKLRATTQYDYDYKNKIYNNISNCRVFKYENVKLTNVKDIKEIEIQYLKNDLEYNEIDLPFKDCWFESLNIHYLCTVPMENQIIALQGFLIHEISPHYYESIGLFDILKPNGKDFIIEDMIQGATFSNIKDKKLSKDLEALVKKNNNMTDAEFNTYKFFESLLQGSTFNLLNKMNDYEMIEAINTHKTYRKNNAQTFKINNVIKISKYKRSNNPNGNLSTISKIKYSHRFEVRGHWRKLSSEEKIGKDRNGEYNINGFTWVNEFEKGDKELPLIEKTRIIIN